MTHRGRDAEEKETPASEGMHMPMRGSKKNDLLPTECHLDQKKHPCEVKVFGPEDPEKCVF